MDDALTYLDTVRERPLWQPVPEHIAARNVEQAHSFGRLVEADPELEMPAPIGMDIVCFRFNPSGLEDPALNTLNKVVLMQFHDERGIAVPTFTTLNNLIPIPRWSQPRYAPNAVFRWWSEPWRKAPIKASSFIVLLQLSAFSAALR